MALTLIATPGATDANTYATKAQASAVGGYWESRLFRTNWTGATTLDKNAALVWATRLLDDWVDWYGDIVNDTQALRWPRYSAYTPDDVLLDSDAIPQFLIDATAELAGFLLAADPTGVPGTLGFKRLKVSSLELEVDNADRDSETVLPDAVKVMVEAYGNIRTRGRGGVAKLHRA